MTGSASSAEAGRPTPILLLGSARSGTTWLGNLIAGHPAVAGAQHEVHWGLAESRLYQTAQYAGDLQDPTQLVRFLELFGASDYFRLAGGQKDRFYRHPPEDFYELFFELMDSFAARTGASHWVTKLDPMFLYRPHELRRFLTALDARYPSTKFVGIHRRFPDVLRSYLNMEGEQSIHALRGLRRYAAVALESGRYVSHRQALRSLVLNREGLIITFEQLRDQRPAALEAIADFLGIEPGALPERDRYRPNSSHHTRRREDAASKAVTAVAERLLVPIFERAPAAADLLLKVRDRTRRARPPFYFRLLQLDLMPESLARHLENTGQTALREQLFAGLEHGVAPASLSNSIPGHEQR